MRILVLGGCGIQGLTAISDLVRSKDVEAVICADSHFKGLERLKNVIDLSKVEPVTVNADDETSLIRLYQKADVVIDLLPRQLTETVCQAALQTVAGCLKKRPATIRLIIKYPGTGRAF